MELLGYVLLQDFGPLIKTKLKSFYRLNVCYPTFTCSLFAQWLDARTFPSDLSKIGVIRINDEIALVAD